MIDPVLYKDKHKELHTSLDTLIAEFMLDTMKLISEATVFDLLEWSYKQTVDEDDMRGSS